LRRGEEAKEVAIITIRGSRETQPEWRGELWCTNPRPEKGLKTLGAWPREKTKGVHYYDGKAEGRRKSGNAATPFQKKSCVK